MIAKLGPLWADYWRWVVRNQICVSSVELTACRLSKPSRGPSVPFHHDYWPNPLARESWRQLHTTASMM